MDDLVQSIVEQNAAEGQLPVDIVETATELIISAPLAGADPAQVDIAVNGDVLTIRGERDSGIKVSAEHFVAQECWWGSFSRSIILPVEVKGEEAVATFHNGLLRITLPKVVPKAHIEVVVIDEE